MDSTVALVRNTEYVTERVEASVWQAVNLLGGIRRFVQPGQRVLVKPNLVQSSDPDKAIVTHPAVVRAVVKLVQEAGGRVLIADNPFVPPVSRRGWDNLYDQVEYAAIAAETGAELNYGIVPQQRSHPEGRLVKLVDTSSFLSECDVVISVPKLKTHGLMRYTGAVKNLFGTVPGTIKAGYHVKLQTAERFADMLLDLVTFVKPALTVMDAIVGMDGDGPSAGQPFPIGAILAAADPVALDVAAVGLVGHEPMAVPTVAGAAARGWTTGRLSDLEMLGETLAAMRVSGFNLPPGGRSEMDYVPRFLRPVGTRILVPSPFVTERCIGCGLCIEHCPVRTISQMNGRAQIGLSGCIRCYCCHEVCPEQAIELRQPWLGRKLAQVAR